MQVCGYMYSEKDIWHVLPLLIKCYKKKKFKVFTGILKKTIEQKLLGDRGFRESLNKIMETDSEKKY